MVCPITPDEDFNVAILLFIALVAVVMGFTAGNRHAKIDNANYSEKPISSIK